MWKNVVHKRYLYECVCVRIIFLYKVQNVAAADRKDAMMRRRRAYFCMSVDEIQKFITHTQSSTVVEMDDFFGDNF